MNRLLTLRTSDGETIQYPRSLLKRTCGTIAEALAESIDGDIEIPFTSRQLDLFLELLESRRLPSADPIAALEVADYLDLQLTQTEIQTILNELNLEQADEFLLEAGFKELSARALHHLLTHRTDLVTFTGLTLKERFVRFSNLVLAKEELKILELVRLLIPVVSQLVRPHLAFYLEAIHDVDLDIPKDYLDKLKLILPVCQSLIFKDGEMPPLAPLLRNLGIVEPPMAPPPPIEILHQALNERRIVRLAHRNGGEQLRQQLRDEEEQLRQQLRDEEEQLRQQLRDEEEQLRERERQLRDEGEQLRDEGEQLRDEGEQLREELRLLEESEEE